MENEDISNSKFYLGKKKPKFTVDIGKKHFVSSMNFVQKSVFLLNFKFHESSKTK